MTTQGIALAVGLTVPAAWLLWAEHPDAGRQPVLATAGLWWLAALFGRLLDGQAPTSQSGDFRRYHRLGSDPARWVRAFFADVPDWEPRLRRGVEAMQHER